MRIVGKARNHMPVQVRDHVAEAGEIDLVRPQQLAQGLFDAEHHGHAVGAVGGGEVAHFLHVRIPDHAAEAGIAGLVDVDHPAMAVLPQQGAAGGPAQFAAHLR
jgi:hypothetical protein